MKTVPIKIDWDAQPHIDERKGHHVIRTVEQNLLVDFIKRRSEGSLLVSGKRGVGKSSIIFTSIQKAKEGDSDWNIMPVIVYAPFFDEHQVQNPQELQNFKKTIFQTLIRRLYTPGSDDLDDTNAIIKGLKTEIEEIYTKAVAKEVIQEIKRTATSKESESLLKTTTLGIGSKTIGKLLGFALVGGLIAVGPFDFLGWAKYPLSLLIGAIPTIWYSFKRTKVESEELTSEYKAKEFYTHDYDLSNLQADLEKILKKLSMAKCKVVFVVDELDKIKPDNVSHAIQSLKSLITHGYAIFVFVTDDEFFSKVEGSSIKRSADYTMFTHRIFLQRPLFQEMEQFIDEILDIESDNSNFKEKNLEYRDFRNYLCYMSKIDFFDLNHVIRDHVVGYDNNGRPLLNFEMDDTKTTFSRLQKAMGQVYSRKAYSKPSDWQKNDILLKRLYWFLEKITAANPGMEVRIVRGNPSQLIIGNTEAENIYDDIEFSTITDLIKHLSRLNFFEYLSEERVRIKRTIERVPKNPIDVISKEEQEFIEAVQQFQHILQRYSSLMWSETS